MLDCDPFHSSTSPDAPWKTGDDFLTSVTGIVTAGRVPGRVFFTEWGGRSRGGVQSGAHGLLARILQRLAPRRPGCGAVRDVFALFRRGAVYAHREER